MSYADTVCPCGDKKPPNTMLCDGCETAFAQHPSMLAFKDKRNDFESLNHAARTLVILARDRKRGNRI